MHNSRMYYLKAHKDVPIVSLECGRVESERGRESGRWNRSERQSGGYRWWLMVQDGGEWEKTAMWEKREREREREAERDLDRELPNICYSFIEMHISITSSRFCSYRYSARWQESADWHLPEHLRYLHLIWRSSSIRWATGSGSGLVYFRLMDHLETGGRTTVGGSSPARKICLIIQASRSGIN